MPSSAENVAKLKDAYHRWDQSKGKDTSMWTTLFSEHVRLRSLAAGKPGLEFTMDCHSSEDVARYFSGLAKDWTMIHYTTQQFAVEGDRVVMLGRTAWENRKTGRRFDTPKVDLVTFRDGRVVEFLEFYDTAMVLAAAQG
jgi:ketosteroid isomerase-like protein